MRELMAAARPGKVYVWETLHYDECRKIRTAYTLQADVNLALCVCVCVYARAASVQVSS